MGKMKYKISSRATILLGRESVSKVDGAIIELVKNTYDADATLCVVYFDIENDTIYILDNGVGMTEEIIENQWMMIGTDNKREQYLSEKKRVKSGEKGIGRFALDRLGSKCQMYTKHNDSHQLILWETNWESFEQSGKNLDEIEANFDYIGQDFVDIIPKEIVNDLEEIKDTYEKDKDVRSTVFEGDYLSTGTLFVIKKLRDKWTQRNISNLLEAMGYLIPPSEQKDYILCLKEDIDKKAVVVDNEVSDEYDYRIDAKFDGEYFYIDIIRNEFDLDKIPEDVFDMKRFQVEPYRKEDFERKLIQEPLSISQLMANDDEEYIKVIREIGKFEFQYTFMKMSIQEDSQETFYYKEISKKRKIWLDQHSGIKIYRDNFLVRPYGDKQSDAFDWLGLDARRAKNPAGISNPSGKWQVRNKQGQGTIFISRISNGSILDKSSREGIIENNHFRIFKDVIKQLISRFEKDRAYIGYTMKLYADKMSEKERTKKSGMNIANDILETKKKKKPTKTTKKAVVKRAETLAKAVKIYEEEREELISEIKLLRSLATNGLITTSIVHDLKGINAILVNRVDSFATALAMGNKMLIDRNIEDFKKNDIFLKSWISALTNQIKSDKRKRLKKDVYATIKEIIQVLEPILVQKKIDVSIECDNNPVFKRIFISDFESIIYNLVINSIESFEKCKIDKRIINISLESNKEFIFHYNDNGRGIDNLFKNPYEIFNFGTSSKFDVNGDQTGTGLGMYIVASTAREYNATYKITEYKNGFGIDICFPL
jgi:signal transduction histidine kinase